MLSNSTRNSSIQFHHNRVKFVFISFQLKRKEKSFVCLCWKYETSIEINGIKGKYYADTTIFRDRLDQPTINSTIIIDFQIYRQYVIIRDQCTYADIPGKIYPLLSFATYLYKGNVTHNQIPSYLWTGCHNYEVKQFIYNHCHLFVFFSFKQIRFLQLHMNIIHRSKIIVRWV